LSKNSLITQQLWQRIFDGKFVTHFSPPYDNCCAYAGKSVRGPATNWVLRVKGPRNTDGMKGSMTKDKTAQGIRDELAALREEIALLQQELVETHAIAAEALRIVQQADHLSRPLNAKLQAAKTAARPRRRATKPVKR
jgi:hypothetical protein